MTADLRNSHGLVGEGLGPTLEEATTRSVTIIPGQHSCGPDLQSV